MNRRIHRETSILNSTENLDFATGLLATTIVYWPFSCSIGPEKRGSLLSIYENITKHLRSKPNYKILVILLSLRYCYCRDDTRPNMQMVPSPFQLKGFVIPFHF